MYNNNSIWRTVLLLTAVLIVTLIGFVAPFAYAQEGVALTQVQQDFLTSRNHTLRYAYSTQVAPMEYIDKDGLPRGIVIEIVKLLAKRGGFEVEFVACADENQVINAVNEGRADFCITESTQTPSYDPTNESKVFLQVPLSIIRRYNATDTVAKTGIVKSYDCLTQYIDETNTEQVFFTSIEECLEAILDSDIDQAILSSYATNYHLSLSKYTTLTKTTYPDTSILQVFWSGEVTTADDEVMLSIFDLIIDTFSVADITEIVTTEGTNEQLTSLWEILSDVRAEVLILIMLIFGAVVACLVLMLLTNRRLARETENILFTDELTGLYSKKGFENKAHIILAQHAGNTFYIMSLDIDRFENYNAIYGFDAGDKLLQDIASALITYADKYEIVARYDADHFVVLMENPDMDKLLESVETFNAFVRSRHEDYTVKLSFGIYKITDINMHIGEMVDRAVAAKRLIKGVRDRYLSIYDEKLYEEQARRALLISDCDLAIDNKEFVPYYQPKIDLCKGTVTGYEALARWIKPDGTVLPPAEFIEVCESAGLISRLDFLIYEQVCTDIARLARLGVDMHLVSVNFSRANMYDSQFVKKLVDINKKYGVDTGLIEIEVTESMFMGDHEVIKNVLNNLHHAGFTVSIDDFGSDYSALNLLIDSNFDIVKLDRVFFTHNASSVKGHTVVNGIIDLSKKLGLKIVAEGVETERQIEFLQLCGCDIAQGFYYSRPVPLDEAVKFAKEAAINSEESHKSFSFTNEEQLVNDERIRSSIIMDKQRFRTVYDTLPIGLSIWSTEINKVYELNKATCTILGRTEEELLNTNWRTFIHPDDIESVKFTYDQLWQGKKNRIDYTLRFYRPDGKMIWTEVSEMSFGYNEQGDRLHLMMLNDVTQRHVQEEQLRVNEQRYRIIEQSVGESTFDYQVAIDTFTVPPKGDKQEIVMVDFLKNFILQSTVHKDDRAEVLSKLLMCINTINGVDGRMEYRSMLFSPHSSYAWCRCYYTPICDEKGNVIHIVGRIENIDEEKKSVLSLQHEVNLDPLTRLNNKEYTRMLCERVARNKRKEDFQAAIMIDLDNFRHINATKGHLEGDKVIRSFSTLLKVMIPENAILGRVGGDEFLVWLTDTTREDVKTFVQRLIVATNKLNISGAQDNSCLGISVGIAYLYREEIDSTALISRADAAMYRAKNSGKNQYAIYTRDYESKKHQSI